MCSTTTTTAKRCNAIAACPASCSRAARREQSNPTTPIRAFVRAQAKLLGEHPHFPLLVRELVDHQATHMEQAISGCRVQAPL